MWETQCNKLGNRLTRRPCKGDEFEILIFEGKRQNAGICRSRQKMFAKWAFISIGRRVIQEWKFAFRLRGDSILLFKGQKKTLEIYDFQSSESYQGGIHSSSFFLFSTLAVPERLWQSRTHSLQQGSVVTPCPAAGPCVPFFVHALAFFVEASTEVDITWCPQFKHFAIWHNHFDNNVIYFLVITYTFHLVSTFINQDITTSSNPPPTHHPHPPLMIIRQHVQRVHFP